MDFLGERKTTLTENREPRRALDDAYDKTLEYCLAAGLWNFATRTARIEYDSDLTPDFGYRRAFTKPDDWVRTVALCSDEFFQCPVLACSDEQGFWFCDLDTVYVKYVSNDTDYGLDLSLWPETYARWVESQLALRIHKRLTQSNVSYDELKKESKKLLADAKSKDAMNEGPQFPPPGTWSSARRGGGSRNPRLGNSLIG